MTVVASNFERRKNELYETESWATEALLRSLPMLRPNASDLQDEYARAG